MTIAATVAVVAEFINFVHALAPSAKLTSKEAGAFLRVAQATLERWRRDSSGPEYIQSGGKGARGTNQAIRYRSLRKYSCASDRFQSAAAIGPNCLKVALSPTRSLEVLSR